MKLAISNIAWPLDTDAAVADALVDLGVTGIEVGQPRCGRTRSKQATRPSTNTAASGSRAASPSSRASPVVRPFRLNAVRRRRDTGTHLHLPLRHRARLCPARGEALVFGSPKNRRIGNRACDGRASRSGRVLRPARGGRGLTWYVRRARSEPAGVRWDFITDAGQAAGLVMMVNHPGFRLHLDSACMTLAGDDPDEVIPVAAPLLAHFHASEPQLAPLSTGGIDHARFTAQTSGRELSRVGVRRDAAARTVRRERHRRCAVTYAHHVYGT